MTETSLARAQHLLSAAARAADEQHVPVAAVVVDAAGRTVASLRQDGAAWVHLEAARRKAATAAALGLDTAGLSAMSAADPLLAAGLSGSELLALPGGVPLPARSGSGVVGGLGIAGGHYSQDHAIADAATQQQSTGAAPPVTPPAATPLAGRA